MTSDQQFDFVTARIEDRVFRLKKAIADKNTAFDIKHLKEAVMADLKTAEETSEVITKNVEKEKAEEVAKRLLDIQQEVEVNLDAFNRLV